MNKKVIIDANKPTDEDGKEYHLRTAKGSIAPFCLMVGSPARARMIARNFFTGMRRVGGDGRQMWCYTGKFKGMPVSVVTTGIGSPSIGIALPEAVRCGARRIIRVGSCSALQKGPKPGDVTIWTGAVRLEGASKNWAPIEFPAVADFRMVAALEEAAKKLGYPYHLGIGATTDDFNEGQARPDDGGWIPPRLQAQHEELVRRGVIAYSMEESCLYVWCATHGMLYTGGLWTAAIDAVYGNRQTGEFAHKGDEKASEIALNALLLINRKYPLTQLIAR